MKRKLVLFGIMFFSLAMTLYSQKLVKAEDIITGSSASGNAKVRIEQDIRIDSLLSRHIDANREYKGIDGFRIQIYRGSARNAREEANKANADFISEFPDVSSYLRFDQPNFFKVRVGDYRTKHDAYPDYIMIRKKFPNAYIVTDIINFPDLGK